MEKELYSFTIEEQIKYNTTGGIRIKDLIKSLESLEELTKQSRNALSDILGVKIHSIDLKVSEIKEGSMIETVHAEVKYYNENKEDVDNTFKQFVKNNKMKTGIFGAVIAGTVAFGIWHYVSGGNPNAVNVNVSGSYNNVIVNSAGAVGVPVETFQKAIENSPTNKNTLARNAIEFISPAKQDDQNAHISFAGNNVVLPSELVSETPTEYVPQSDEKELPLDNITLHIRASDRDSYTKGWYGYVDGLFTKRVKIDIPQTIDLTVLAKQESIKADITLYSIQKGEKTEFKRIEIRSVHTK
ncbi:hypothetical protein [Mannheimia indoligenes]|uniref:Uncharacterized protein n=1 Tax=Mannheimia indoligenes TaxID=3103145 RepID=A0ABU7ZEC7_9PAST